MPSKTTVRISRKRSNTEKKTAVASTSNQSLETSSSKQGNKASRSEHGIELKQNNGSPNEKKRKRIRILDPIDLSDVPYQAPISKNAVPSDFIDNSRQRPIVDGKSSQYTGIYFDTNTRKWHAQMMINGVVRNLGYFEEEVDAAVVYAKAAHKYKPKKSEGEIYAGLNLTNVPEQPLVRNESAASGYKGVKRNKKRWEARINGKTLGTFDSVEDAAGIYARAAYYMKCKTDINDIADSSVEKVPV